MNQFEAFITHIDSQTFANGFAERFVDPLLKKPKNYSGLDRVSSKAFLKKPNKHVQTVLHQILKPGFKGFSSTSFTFTPTLLRRIPKANKPTESRPISISSIKGLGSVDIHLSQR